MYSDETTRIPADEDDLWTILREQFELARMAALDSEIESEDEALGLIDNEETRQKQQLKGLSALVPYRGTSFEVDNRDHFLEMGCALLPYVEKALKARNLTPEFFQQWSKLMFCHGFIASYLLDDSDPLVHKRAGHKTGKLRSKNAQRKWIAHIMIPLIDGGMKREPAEEIVVAHVKAALRDEELCGGFPVEWFMSIVSRGELVTTYDFKHFAIKAMRKLLGESIDDIPPIPKIP